MGVLDSVLVDTGSQLGISTGTATSVLSGLLNFINQEAGGVGGFLERFRRAGLGNMVTSWLGGDPKTVSAEAVESAIGHQAIEQIGSRAGLSFSTAASAIALMLPKLIQRLTPNGVIPSRLSADLLSSITAPSAAVTAGARQVASSVAASRPGGRYLWILAAVLLGALLAMWLSNRSAPPVPTVSFNIEEHVRTASRQAIAALNALRPGFGAKDLVSALNLNIVNFETGSTQIPADSTEFLNRAATALKSAPAGTVLEIGGHTDNVGSAATNLQLSQQRADAVRNYLMGQGVNGAMLTAQGYGDTRPVASNTTDQGRFQNRRIEFNVK